MRELIEGYFGDRYIEYEGYDDWLKDRVYHGKTHEDPARYRIGGSMAASILGVGWGSPWSVYREYIDGVGQELSESEMADCLRGKRLEKVVADFWSATKGVALNRCSARVIHSSMPWASVSPDAFMVDNGDLVGVEIKTSREPWKWGVTGQIIDEWVEGYSEHIIPGRVAAQVYWSLAVTGLQRWTVIVAIPGLGEFLDLRTYEVVADPAVQAAIVQQIATWRERHLINELEPEIDGSRGCKDALADRFRELRNPVRMAEPGEADLVRDYARVSANIKIMTEQKARLRNEIIAAIGDGRGVTLSSGGKAIVSRPKNNRTPMLRVSGVKYDG